MTEYRVGNWHELDRAMILLIGFAAFELCTRLPVKPLILRYIMACILGEEVKLIPMEFSILWYLCERQGVVFPSEELFEEVWGEKYLNNNNTVMAHIGRLREKLDEPARSPWFILRSAVNYSYDGTEISIEAERGEGRVTLKISNHGAPISVKI